MAFSLSLSTVRDALPPYLQRYTQITRDRKGVWRVEGYGAAVERVEKEYGKEKEGES